LWLGRDETLTIAAHRGTMDARPISHYAREVRAALPPSVFEPVPARLAWLALHLAVIFAGTVVIARGVGGWPLSLAVALIVGHGFAGLAFVGHETLHGAVVRARWARYLVGYVCFLPFVVPPRLWVAWHNRVHHGHTMAEGVDPDAYPTLQAYQRSRLTRAADLFALGYRHWLGVTSLLVGFTGQSMQVLWRLARPQAYLSRAGWWAAVGEQLLGVVIWGALAWVVGARAFMFVFVVPLAVGNVIVMSYILTNHSLSPLTDVNDPLLNSLSVTTPRLVARLHLDFGLHVEHHLFPAMSSRHAGRVRALLLARWPDRYQSMPLHRALAHLWRTSRVYKEPTRLTDPKSGREWSTLLPAALE
jgi:fatty acid desaturase